MSDNLAVKGMEVEEPRMKKVAAMRRAVDIIKNYNQSNYIDMAEAELGPIYHHDWVFEPVPDKPGYSQLVDNESPEEKKHNRKVYNRAREIEEQEWKELFTILQGQNHKEYNRLYKKARTEGMRDDKDLWNNWFNGTGLKGWWD
jgi:5-methylcytosine-specific restriction endonuclease McrA